MKVGACSSRSRISYVGPLLVILLAGLVHADDDEKDARRAERRLQNQEARAKSLSTARPAADPGNFLDTETRRLMERCRTFAPNSYEFSRTVEAVDDLLDAREDLQAAAQGKPDSRRERDSQASTAKRLERAYFRVQQGEYFARLSADSHASEYVALSRQLYQKARAAYDVREYPRANSLASASSELVDVLENLAQATVRRPEPPVLK